MQTFWKIIGLSGDIASIASFPLVVIPVVIYWIWKERGAEMTSGLKLSLCGVFALGLVAYGLDIADRWGFIGPKKFTYSDAPPRTVISGQKFANEEVSMDGKTFRNNRFENVTFLYNGTSPLDFSNNIVTGQVRIKTENPAVLAAIAWMEGFGATNNNFAIEQPPGWTLQRPNTGTKSP